MHAAGQTVSLVDAHGAPPTLEDGSDAVAVQLTDANKQQSTRLERNEHGTFYRVFQPNKWRLKKQAEAAAAAEAAVVV